MRVAVLASGVGTNLQALLDTVHGRDGIEVVAVASDRPAAMALERARSAGVEAQAFPAEAFDDRVVRDQAMGDWLAARDVELVVLAGYMQLLTGAFLGRFPGRVINVHPALLPVNRGWYTHVHSILDGTPTGVTLHAVSAATGDGTRELCEALWPIVRPPSPTV